MNEKLKKLLEKSKVVLKHITIYSIIGIACIASFLIGRYYDRMVHKNSKVEFQVQKVKSSDVDLAIDQSDNLIIIDNKTGNYTIYQDSVGRAIFSLYAKNVWGQHNVIETQTP